MARPSRYPAELRNRAVRMVAEVRPDYPTEWSAMKAVAAKLGVKHAETVRGWVRKAEVDAGARPGTTTEESAEPKIGRRCLVPVNALAECLALLVKEAA